MENVLGHNADIALDMVIEDELGRDGWLVLTTSAVSSLGRGHNGSRRACHLDMRVEVGRGVVMMELAVERWSFRRNAGMVASRSGASGGTVWQEMEGESVKQHTRGTQSL